MPRNTSGNGTGDAAPGAQAAVTAGVAAGILGLVVFLGVHALWITPIWSVVPFGVFAAGLAGAGVGWAYHHLRARFGRSSVAVLVLSGTMLAATAPAQVGAWLRPPIRSSQDFDAVFGALEISWVVAELTVAPFAVAGLLGWWVLRERSGALALALAGSGFALTMGHNVPFVGSSPATAKMWAIMALSSLAGAVTLVTVEAALRKARPPPVDR